MDSQAGTKISCPVDTPWCTDHELLGAGEECVTLVASIPLVDGTGLRTAHRDGDAILVSVQRYPGEPARVEVETANTSDLDDIHWWTANEAEAIAMAQLKAVQIVKGAKAAA